MNQFFSKIPESKFFQIFCFKILKSIFIWNFITHFLLPSIYETSAHKIFSKFSLILLFFFLNFQIQNFYNIFWLEMFTVSFNSKLLQNFLILNFCKFWLFKIFSNFSYSNFFQNFDLLQFLWWLIYTKFSEGKFWQNFLNIK